MAKSTSGVLLKVADRILVQVSPAPFPAEEAVRRVFSDRWLGVQLHLFNLAYRQEDHATAIRLLHLLCENRIPKELRNFNHVRNFVSHASLKPKTRAFIEGELGPETAHYDPFNTQHRAFVNGWRGRAENALRTVLEGRLRVTMGGAP